MSHHHHALARRRGYRAPTDGTPEAGGAVAAAKPEAAAKPSPFMSIEQLAEMPADLAPEPTPAPTPKTKPAPEPAVEEAEDNPGEQITGEAGDEAPEQETPEQEKARLLKEVAELEAAAKDKELTELRAKLAKLKGEPEAEPAESAAEPRAPGRFRSEAEIDKAAAAAVDFLEFAELNEDGFEGTNNDGTKVNYTAEQVKEMRRRALRDLHVNLPGERRQLRERAAAEAAARTAHPTHFDARHADHAAVQAIFKELPGIAGNHRVAAEILAARRGAAKPAPGRGVPPAATTAPAKPPVKAAPPLSGGAGGVPPATKAAAKAPAFDFRRAMRGGEEGIGALAEFYAQEFTGKRP